jgi:nucleoside-diphosphate-sugar epimerase
VIARRALRGEPIRVAGAEAVGDWLQVSDVARAMLALIDSTAAEPVMFNIAYGEAVSIRELIETVATLVPGTGWQETTPDQADVVGYPHKSHGAWGAYDNSRLRALGWSPTPLAQAFAEYVDWLRQNPG